MNLNSDSQRPFLRMRAAKAFVLRAHVLRAHVLRKLVSPALALRLASLSLLLSLGQLAAAADAQWLAVWAASPQSSVMGGASVPSIEGQTLRQRMPVTFSGNQLRVRISNEHGTEPLVIGAASVGTPTNPASVVAGSLRPLTFGGRPGVTASVGAVVISDPVDFNVQAGKEVSLSLYLPNKVTSPTVHMVGLQTAVVTPPGDFTGATQVEAAATTPASLFVSALMVPKPEGAGLIVALGDSITDGTTTTVDQDHPWPSGLARRLNAAGKKLAVVNQGISGNQLRRDGAGLSAQARFDRDVLAMPGVTHVVVLVGINDIGWPGARMGSGFLVDPQEAPSVDDIISGYQQLIARAKLHGIKIIGATLTPFADTGLPDYYTPQKETVRLAVNQWMRTSGAFDAVIDFDAALRDPAKPEQIRRGLVAPDNIHPNDAGQKVMAEFIDLKLFD